MATQTYKCVRRCYFGKGETVLGKAPNRRIYEVGETEQFDPASERIPRHFVPVEEFAAVRPEEPHKPILKGLRAPVDPDKLEEIEKKRKSASILDAHKAAGEEAREKKEKADRPAR